MDGAQEHGGYGHLNATMILLAYRHGLRAGEVYRASRVSRSTVA
jgi:hypothetical protein